MPLDDLDRVVDVHVLADVRACQQLGRCRRPRADDVEEDLFRVVHRVRLVAVHLGELVVDQLDQRLTGFGADVAADEAGQDLAVFAPILSSERRRGRSLAILLQATRRHLELLRDVGRLDVQRRRCRVRCLRRA